MGEALMSGGAGGSGTIYKWKRYELNSSTRYTWNRYSLSSSSTYKWNKYDTSTETSYDTVNWGFQPLVDSNCYVCKTVTATSDSKFMLGGCTRVGFNHDVDPGKPTRGEVSGWFCWDSPNQGIEAWIQDGDVKDIMYKLTNTWWYHSNWTGYNTLRCYNPTLKTIKGSTSLGTVTSSSYTAYPSNGVSGSYWYEYAGVASTSYYRGSYIDTVSSTNSSAYPNGSWSGSYWYDTRTSSTTYSQGAAAGTVYNTNRNAYPDNSYTGSYWYVFDGEA